MNLPPLKRIALSASLDSVKRNLVLNFRKLFSIDELLLTLKNFRKDAVYENILNGINHIQSLKELCKHIDFLKNLGFDPNFSSPPFKRGTPFRNSDLHLGFLLPLFCTSSKISSSRYGNVKHVLRINVFYKHCDFQYKARICLSFS